MLKIFPLLFLSLFIPTHLQGKIISVNFREIGLQDALRLISKQGKINLVISKDVGNEKISLDLTDIDTEEALTLICKTNALQIEKRGKVILISKTAINWGGAPIRFIKLNNSAAIPLSKTLNSLNSLNSLEKQTGVRTVPDPTNNQLILIQEK